MGLKTRWGEWRKGSAEKGGRERNGGMRGRGSDEKTDEECRQMVTFNNGDGEVAMS